MRLHASRCRRLLVAAALVLLASRTAAASDTLCDPGFQDCRTPLFRLIQNEQVGIDLAMIFMEDEELAQAIIARFKAGVRVRALVEPRRTAITPQNGVILDMFRAAGIPMRNRNGGGMLHWKFMNFAGQNQVQFSAANYSDYYFKPATPYLDYTDEAIYFGNDPGLVNSFRTKFDDTWINTTAFVNYANISGTLTREYPVYPIDPELNFVPFENFLKRSVPLYDAEKSGIDVIMYKITEPGHADAMIRAFKRGVPVRIITEPDLYRKTSNVWQAYNVDRMYAAGISIRDRAHAGFLHEKATLLQGQQLTIFGSSNWSLESNSSQYEHNYFTAKDNFFAWFQDNFERKWTNRTGNAETKPFTPLAPDAPIYTAPANGATGVTTASTVYLSWKPGLWAHRADVYFGTSASPPLIATGINVSPSSTKSYALPALAAGTTYYWRIVSKTMAGKEAAGPLYSFTTAGTGSEDPPPPPPPPPGASEIVLYAARASVVAGTWKVHADSTAAGGQRIGNANANLAKVSTPLATPANYFELTFNATAGVAYHLWIRGKADGNAWSNDSAYVQFSGSVTQQGAAAYRINTTSSAEYNLESCSGCGLSGWGWEDNGYGTGVRGPAIYFATTGSQRIRVQTREDGLSIDQIVLSPATYLTTAPGPTKNDGTILPASGGTSEPPPPPPSGGGDIVLYASDATQFSGTWRLQADSTAAGGQRAGNPNAGTAKIVSALAAPPNYVEFTFNAEAGRGYRLWIRGKAEGNAWSNDSAHIQFSGSVNAQGTPVYRIGSTTSTEFNLESCSGCGLSGWGWEDNAYGIGTQPALIYFAVTGPQRVRLQTREDGLWIDQLVLSPSTYLSAAPGAAKNDTRIVPKS